MNISVISIWLTVDKALEKYKQYRHLITASNYITPFNPVSEGDVKRYFESKEYIDIASKTPSVGEIWPTHPSYRYISTSKELYDRNIIFCKVSNEQNVATELENLHKMEKHISVPKPIEMIRHTNDVTELKELKPHCKIAAMLVEEFIDSISIGRAMIEERVEIEHLVDEVVDILKNMHEFCTHRDLKQSHIRICLDPDECWNLTFGIRSSNELIIHQVSIIDVETAKMNSTLDKTELEQRISNDINQFLVSLTGYLSTLEHVSEDLKKILPMPHKDRLKRFGILLEKIFEHYVIPTPSLVIKHSKTMEYLLEYISNHG
jgi:hypothetical protein